MSPITSIIRLSPIISAVDETMATTGPFGARFFESGLGLPSRIHGSS